MGTAYSRYLQAADRDGVMSGTVTESGRGVVALHGEEVPYLLVRVRSRKRMSVRVDERGMVQVRIPWRVTVHQTEQFVCDHATWLLGQIRQAQQNKAAQSTLPEGKQLPFLDGHVQLRYGAGQIRPLFQEGEQLWVAERYREQPALTEVLEEWYRQQANHYLPVRLDGLSARMGLSCKGVTIRNQKSRWGSCSARKTISLNWRLICMPTRVGDYVMVHELSHLRHMNHSPAFWSLVASFIPEYLACRRALRQFSPPW
ncbi:MAG: M48 family metallopeptidase [Magnetococcus sp. XQGC-1]